MKENPENVILFPLAKPVEYVAPATICPNRHHKLSRPVVIASVFLHRRLSVHPVVSKYTVVLSAMFGGAYMACNPLHGIPHFIWDGIAYSIHGIGIAPLAEAILRRVEKTFNNSNH